MKPTEKVEQAYARIAEGPLGPVWISLVPQEAAMVRARAAEEDAAAGSKPLAGWTFAVKDNIDVAGVATTAGCPAYAFEPAEDAAVVARLFGAGAVAIGKTNMDQFATGLVGTRSPYGACSSVFDGRYISGGSSSGSAVAVAQGLVDFALGTDTAGSGRVPAAFNGLVGLKPTRGLLSTRGVVPACRTIDCVSIFTRTCREAHAVWKAARGFDEGDGYSRAATAGQDAAPWLAGGFRFGVPREEQLEFFGDEEAARLYGAAVARVESLGGVKTEIDFKVFRAAAELLYAGPWVAERRAALGPFVEAHAAEMDPVVRGIIAGASRYTAVEAFAASYRLADVARAAEREWARMDVMVLPTAGTIYTHEAIAADPVGLNTNLGYYTNFVNLMDLAAVAVPAGVRPDGLPFGISFIGRAFSDEALLALGGRFCGEAPALEYSAPPGCVALAVVGAHLTGQPLNGQLTGCGARLMRTCRTAPGYRLYALAGTVPPKPGLVREDGFAGPGIEVEVWAVPENTFGGFVAAVPAPLGIGSAVLEDGAVVKSFICEPWAVAGAEEITGFGGWRAYRRSKSR
jgi:allophanate hydrolase